MCVLAASVLLCDSVACSSYILQLGIVVYSARPKVWFLLNRHSNSETLLQEILSTPFEDGPGNAIGVCVLYVLVCVCMRA